ncbi:anti-anti-sigma regulatory factor, SpoIIAA [Desulfotomaculum arcticum]|uniref:Anti-sigma factor antagonist n=1 Tax=Desulfotruncus arcticus DSM 17038 TaxID=1121424 RepID=A0A1I2MRY0_9FIRM|nr:anti-sigma factor antagonist [Desulfotruncus arcticus]SFF94264.1 anti-anti-sigma regulatory factor, SpoIIAA [Desulfotomaculum arcticum] [Desulfotruncus arcticus DSM 17038]
MNYAIKKEKNCLLVAVFGEIDISITDSLREDVDRALDNYGSGQLVIDLSGVDFIDSSGLGVILGRYKKVAGKGGKVFLAGAKPQVKKVLELSGLLNLMEEYNTAAEVIDKIS